MNKRQELSWIHFIRACHPGKLPDGLIEQPDPPAADLLIECVGRRVSIELTQIVPDKNLSIRKAQRNAVGDAQRLFERLERQPVFVNVSFAGGELPQRRRLAEELNAFVSAHTPLASRSFQVFAGTEESRGLPPWMNGISIFEPHHEGADWVGGSVWSVASLSRAKVEQAIKRKAAKLDRYRQHLLDGEVWLLIVVDQIQLAADLAIPSEAAGWRFEHEFDRVILASAKDFLEF
jgi:hypothetical protein